jgi:endonuclease YncB( thermonuclease family)
MRAAVCLLLLLLFGCRAESGSPGTLDERTPCQVMRVFDGDTLACDLNGNGSVENPLEHVRLLGIDAPETRFSKKNQRDPVDDPYAAEAQAFLEKETLGKTVYLAWDQVKTDRYGRTLALVYRRPKDARSVNETLIGEGYAAALFIPPNGLHKERFEHLESRARQARKGIWRPD